jgi:dynein heavy chain
MSDAGIDANDAPDKPAEGAKEKEKSHDSLKSQDVKHVTFQHLAAEATRPLRQLLETEEECVDGVHRIWSAVAKVMKEELDLGRTIALQPWGSLVTENGVAAYFQYSDIFMVHYGLSAVAASPAQGPTMKLSFPAVGARTGFEQSVVGEVVAALGRKFGERCAEFPHVSLSLAEVGTIDCVDQELSFEPWSRAKTEAPLRSMRLQMRAVEKKQWRAALFHADPSEDQAKLKPKKPEAIKPGPSTASRLLRYRVKIPGASQATSQEFSQVLPAAATAPDSPLPSQISRTNLESSLMLSSDFTASVPPLSSQWPESLDPFSRTLAAPFNPMRMFNPVSARIGSNYTPSASFLMLTEQGVQVRVDPSQRASALVQYSSSVDYSMQYPKIEPGSDLAAEVADAGLDERQICECLYRYEYYVSDMVPTSCLAPMNPDWVDNVGYSLRVDRLREMSAAEVDNMLTQMQEEMLNEYDYAMRRAVIDYVFLSPAARERSNILFVPAPLPSWGSEPFVGIEGMFGGAPPEWHPNLQRAREKMTELCTCCPATLRILTLWQEYESKLLVALPAVGDVVDVDSFYAQQMQHRTAIKQLLEQQWSEEVSTIVAQEQIEADYEEVFREGLTALLSSQARSLVERSIDEIVQFFSRFSGPSKSLSPGKVRELKDSDTWPDAFLVIKLLHRGDEVLLKHQTSYIWDRISRIFKDMVTCLKDLPRPDKSRGVRGKTSLWEVDEKEKLVVKAEQTLEQIVHDACVQLDASVHLYDEFLPLLTEDLRVQQFDQEDHAREEYLAEVTRLQAMERKINTCPNLLRLNLACVDCTDLNDHFRSKAQGCVKALLDGVIAKFNEASERMRKQYESLTHKLAKKATSEGELVELENCIEQFRDKDHQDFLTDFQELKDWMDLVWNCGLDGARVDISESDFRAVYEAALCVQKVGGVVRTEEEKIRTQREELEGRFREELTKFSDELILAGTHVAKFAEHGIIRQQEEYIERILSLKERFERAKFEAEKLNEREVMLGFEPTEFEQLQQGVSKLEPYEKLWTLMSEMSKALHHWTRGPLFQLNPETVEKDAMDMFRQATRLEGHFESVKQDAPRGVAEHAKQQLSGFMENLGILHALCNPGLRPRHWEEISTIVGFAMEPDNGFTLSRVIDMEVNKHVVKLQDISENAAKQYSIEKSLDSQLGEWEPVVCGFNPWRETGTFILSGVTADEVQMLVDDHIIKTQTMKGSSFAKPFEERILQWEQFLKDCQDILDVWLQVQSVWLYLEPIFASEDIMKQMPTEGRLFKEVDQVWRRTMSDATEAPNALDVFKAEGMLQGFKECHEKLETVQKGLNDYLETKRLYFARFFFLSNDNLLEILSETKDPNRVQPHLKKAFEGIAALVITPENVIESMISSEKEIVPLVDAINTVECRGLVEQWLLQLERLMAVSIRDQTLKAVEDYVNKGYSTWVQSWPGQVVIGAGNMHWTTEAMQSMDNHGNDGLGTYGVSMNTRLAEIVGLVRGDITSLVRCTLEALIVIFVHNKDTIEYLFKLGIESKDDFDWLAQVRYFLEPNPQSDNQTDMFVRICNSHLSYNYEYLGNSSRLIVTPLTDRCYRTCCGALHLLYGAAPEGPAGTGKTETVKDLSKALARFCVVFNCSDGLDFIAMGKFFKGLAATGGWACFDEFNRIDVEVLSVVAQQILHIQSSIKAKLTEFEFEGSTLPLKWSCNCFITMNPGYAGRAELPDNLKALFRTVAMMVPDYGMIAQIKLYAYGYEFADALAGKIVTTYKLCSEQLSSQHHYDYGMRAVFSVLVAAGNLKRKEPKSDESVLMLRAINDVNLAKFLAFDVPLFEGITSDLFPGITIPKPDYSLLINKLTDYYKQEHLVPHPYQFEKIIQFYECHMVRHSVMLVGMPFAGKTTGLKALRWALTELANEGSMHSGEIVHEERLNPKAIPASCLYGAFDQVSHEWADGIVAVLFRDFARNQSEERKWLVFDGPVDAIWIEDMNTVMDDNKKLCLNSGEIIAMSPNMRTIIEPMDVEVASPATISRNGMVFFEPQLLGFMHVVERELSTGLPTTLDESEVKNLRSVVDFLTTPLIQWVNKNGQPVTPTLDQSLAYSFIRLLLGELKKLDDPELYAALGAKAVTNTCDALAVWSAIWSIGAVCSTDTRPAFSTFVRSLLGGQVEGVKMPKRILFPDRGSAFDHIWIFEPEIKDEGEEKTKDFGSLNPGWRTWLDTKDPQVLPSNVKPESVIVQTMDTIRYGHLCDLLIEQRTPMLFCGPTGTGKTAYMMRSIMSADQETYVPLQIGFSAKSRCDQTQDTIDSKIDRRRKGIYGPPPGKTMLCMIDDLNMPLKETYGAQPPIEILRMLISKVAYPPYGGWYDRKDVTHPFKKIMDFLLLGAMRPPGGGATFVTPRMTALLHIIGFTNLDDDNMSRIFNSILEARLQVYDGDVAGMGKKLVTATLQVYKDAVAELRPTPLKVHYTFNLRDFAKVISGVLMLSKEEADGAGRHVRLWMHENFRVFHDRLTDDQDRDWLLDLCKSVVKKTFLMDADGLCSHLEEKGVESTWRMKCGRLIFGDILSPPSGAKRPYTEVVDLSEMMVKVQGHLQSYNEMGKSKMDLVLFLYCVQHVSRVARILKSATRNALLVGMGGSGRQSVTKLACFMADYEPFNIELTSVYNLDAFREDLKLLLRRAGGKGDNMVFLFTDSQIKEESFVEDINNLLNSGEVPNLFSVEDKGAIAEDCRTAAKAARKDGNGSPNELYVFFLERVRELLSIVLCFSPIGDAWRSRLRQFPSLVNCCTIDWFTAWPEEALQAVAEQQLRGLVMAEKVKTACIEMCQLFHSSSVVLAEKFKADLGRIYYATPTSYLELLGTFNGLLGEKREQVNELKRKYEVGLEKIIETEGSVEGMQVYLTDLKPKLIEKNKEVADMMVVVNEETEKTEIVKQSVEAEENIAKDAAAAANEIKMDCEKELDEAMPALEAALRALDELTAKAISEIKGMKNPPAAVRTVLTAVCVLKQLKPARVKDPGTGRMEDDFWPVSLKMISEMSFLASLKSFDKDNIPAPVIKKLQGMLQLEEMEVDKVEKVSGAAASLCKWCRAMDIYDRVAKVVAPKKEKLAEAESEVADLMAALAEKQRELAVVLAEVQALKDKLQAYTDEKNSLADQVDDCEKKLVRAEKLITSLGSEKGRWTASAQKLGEDYVNLTGDVIVSSGVLAYLGAFTPSFRAEAIKQWGAISQEKQIPGSPEFSLTNCLGQPVKIRDWIINGLPNDSFSIDNGIIVDRSRRYPLCIDPQGQANKWIKKTEQVQKSFTIGKLTDSDWLRRLEGCVNFGNPFLLENVKEELDPALEPLLMKSFQKKGGALLLKLGDALVEFSKDFRFYITTKLGNPHYLPDVAVKVCLLNFMITPVGLEDQLLNLVVQAEKPALAEEKTRITLESAENKKQLEEIENKILHVLSSSEGNILDDETGIEILSQSKVVSNEITVKQEIAEKTEKEIDEARLAYVPVSVQGSIHFFAVTDLATIDPMYQYSLPFFINMFTQCNSRAPPGTDLEDRVQNLIQFFMISMYENICRSLFAKHHILYAFNLCVKILLHSTEVDYDQYRFLLTGGTSLDDPPPSPRPWIPKRTWEEIFRMSLLSKDKDSKFHRFNDNFVRDIDEWKEVYDSSTPLDEMQARTTSGRLQSVADFDSFQQLLVLRCVRPDCLIPGIMRYVSEKLGESFVNPPAFELSKPYGDSTHMVPIIFVLSAGSDPFASLQKFAQDKQKEYKSISLGQGQGPRAEALIDEAHQQGSWVVLQNCHLSTSWMPKLDRMLEMADAAKIHREYRLWLTSYPSNNFPVTILQNAVKVTNEAPKGLRANLLGSYQMDPISSPEFFSSCTREPEMKKFVYALCFFHAVCLERRAFGPLGWNISYEFTESDLRISVRQIGMFLDDFPHEIPLKALTYMTGECNYGGRVTDKMDRCLLMVLMHTYYNKDILEEGYEFAENYKIPPIGEHNDYLDAVQALPALTPPSVFGFHENATLTKDQNEAYTLCGELLLTLGSGSGGGAGASVEGTVGEIAKDVLERIQKPWDVAAIEVQYPVKYEESMNTVLTQELSRYNGLIKVVRSSLEDMQKAIKGMILMSPQLELAFYSVFDGKVPAMWLAKSFPSLKPLGGYVNDLVERLKFYQVWIDCGIPMTFWLSGIYFTQAFTTGILQNYARKTMMPIDTIDFDFDVPKDQPMTKPSDGAYVYGLFLEGARWDVKTWELGESEPKVLFAPFPLIWFIPREADKLASYPNYDCPIYKVSTRKGTLSTTGHSTNFVMPFRIPTKVSTAHWTRRGVALLTSLDT